MAENETKKIEGVVDTDLDFEEGEDAPEAKEGEEDTTDYKALAAKNAGIAKRNATKLAKLKERLKIDKKVEQQLEEKKNEPDYAKLAYLEQKGITSDEDIAWAEKQAKDSGKSLRDLFGAKWFQEELKERREVAATKEAIPSGSKRSVNSTRDSVEYWITKGELPQGEENRKLREDIVAAKRKQSKGGSNFTERPVV
jgi:hypothetical protein